MSIFHATCRPIDSARGRRIQVVCVCPCDRPSTRAISEICLLIRVCQVPAQEIKLDLECWGHQAVLNPLEGPGRPDLHGTQLSCPPMVLSVSSSPAIWATG